MESGVIRYGELESGVRLPRIRMVARQPILPDFTEIGFHGGFQTWGTRIRALFTSDDNGCWATDTPGFHRKGIFRGLTCREMC